MKKICCLLYSIFLLLNSSFAQNPLVKQWDNRFGGDTSEILTSFQQTSDRGYILAGYSYSGIGEDKTQALKGYNDYWIVKIDALGNKQWDKDFGGTDYDQLHSLQETTDGGYILGGYSASGIGGDKTQASKGGDDYWIVKIDSLGNKQWDKDFGATNLDLLYSMQQTTDGGYILGGYSFSGIGGDKTQALKGGPDYWIVKIDALGNKKWDKDFGGTDNDFLNSLQQTTDGGYILGGSSESGTGGDKTQASKGIYFDYWIVKIDSLGNKQWDKDFGGTDDDRLFSLQQTTDGGYILGGISESGIGGDKTQASKGGYDYWIVKIDSLGNKQWDKDFGGTDREDEFGNISQTTDGGYLMAGTSYSNISGDKTENNLGSEQSWIVKTDSVGKKQWDKTLFTTGHEETGLGVQTKDGCYVFANYTYGGIGGYKTQASQGGLDYWIIKFCDTTNLSVVPPQCNFLASDTVLCANDCIGFTNQSSNATSYQWFFPGATISSDTAANPANICYKAAGSYNVKLIAYNSGGSDSITFSNYIHVKPAPPIPSINQIGTTLYCSTDPTYVSYQWYDSTVLIPGATDTLLAISHSGNYNVQVSNSDSCRIAVGINVTIGIISYQMNSTFIIFPNPLTSSAILQFNKQLTNAEVVIYDVMGKEVIRRKITGNRMELEKGNLVSGVYFVRLIADEKQYIEKMVVE